MQSKSLENNRNTYNYLFSNIKKDAQSIFYIKYQNLVDPLGAFLTP